MSVHEELDLANRSSLAPSCPHQELEGVKGTKEWEKGIFNAWELARLACPTYMRRRIYSHWIATWQALLQCLESSRFKLLHLHLVSRQIPCTTLRNVVLLTMPMASNIIRPQQQKERDQTGCVGKLMTDLLTSWLLGSRTAQVFSLVPLDVLTSAYFCGKVCELWCYRFKAFLCCTL